MKREQWLEKAKLYFSGDMPAEEALLFEMQTAASEELSQLMRLWRAVDQEGISYVQDSGQTSELIKTHQDLRSDFSGDNTKVKLVKYLPWRWIAAAAAAAGIITLMKVFIPSPGTQPAATAQNNGDTKLIVKTDSSVARVDSLSLKKTYYLRNLYAQNFSADEVPENTSGPLDDAFFFYASGQYKQAIIAIDSLHKKRVTRGGDSFPALTRFYSLYYKGLSMLSLGDGASAIRLLQQSLSAAPSRVLKAKAQWYLALAYLSENDDPSCIATLEQLLQNTSASSYRQKANNLLSELKN